MDSHISLPAACHRGRGPQRLLAAFGVSLLLTLAACGGNDDAVDSIDAKQAAIDGTAPATDTIDAKQLALDGTAPAANTIDAKQAALDADAGV